MQCNMNMTISLNQTNKIKIKNETMIFFFFVSICCSSALSLSLNDFMGTKALYAPRLSASSNSLPSSQQCVAKSLALVLRHGARHPSQSDLARLVQLQSDLRGARIGDAALNASLHAWSVPYGADDAGLLTTLGADEHYRIGVRLRARYPSLFARPYTPSRYRFVSTRVSRAARSAQSLAFGLFEKDGIVGGPLNNTYLPVFVEMVAADSDFLLRFFKLCPAYAHYEARCCDGKDAFMQRTLAPVAAQLSQRLAGDSGAAVGWNVTIDQVRAIYTACQFENSFGDQAPLFCPLLSKEALAALEFIGDVERERAGARGNPAHDCAADLVRAMRDSMQACANGNGSCATPVSLWFAHAETIIPLSSALRLYEAQPLLSWNATPPPPSELSSWPLSQVSPFAANIGFMLYECAQNATPDGRWLVQAIANEGPVAMPGGNDTVTLEQWLSPALYGKLLAVNSTQLCYSTGNATANSTASNADRANDVLSPTDVIVVACVAALGLFVCSLSAYCATAARNRSIRSERQGKFQTTYSAEKEAAALSNRFLDISATQVIRKRRSGGAETSPILASDDGGGGGGGNDDDDDDAAISIVPDNQKRAAITEGIRDFMSD
jgi:multiple inositol-polyphosphate phosphatase/2,3-bisphosphoglycerate 3-phosphatase